MEITITHLILAGCKSSVAPFLQPFFQEVCNKYQINTPIRFAAFISQLSHESGSFFYTEELASGSDYENRKDLGNVHPGDGVKFKGRGFIQITGRSNYQTLMNEFGIDFITHPELLGGKNINVCTSEQMKWATMSAGWFWNKTGLNSLADKMNLESVMIEPNLSSFKAITKKINGGYNGLDDRQKRFDKIRISLK